MYGLQYSGTGEHITNASIKRVSTIDERGLTLIASVGFDPDVIPKEAFKCVELWCFNKICWGVGLKNKHGGMLFLSDELPVLRPISIRVPGSVVIPCRKDGRSERCCLFQDLFDYLSYRMLSADFEDRCEPKECDCLLMNDYANFPDLMLDAGDYEEINCWFPATQAGQCMATTIMRRYQHSTNMDYIYSSYGTLQEMALSNK